MKRLIVLAATLLLTVTVLAQEALEEQPEEIRRYTVEVIIFAYTQDTYTGSEIFAPDIVEVEDPLVTEDEALVFEDLPATEPEEEEAASVRDIELQLLAEEALTLLDALERLDTLDAYEPLMHFGWTQATWGEAETQPLQLSAFGEVPAGLEGSLTLYLSRYLHLVVDLVLDEERGEQAQPETDFSFFDDRVSADDRYAVETGPVRYRIDEDRIMKNGETRYFDHPKFGVIAKVTRVEEKEPDDDFPESQELLGRLSQ